MGLLCRKVAGFHPEYPSGQAVLELIYSVKLLGADLQIDKHNSMYEQSASDQYPQRLVLMRLARPWLRHGSGAKKIRSAIRLFCSLSSPGSARS